MDDATIIAAYIAAAAAFVVAIVGYIQGRIILAEGRRAEKRKDIMRKLDEFYGPLMSYINILSGLNNVFRRGKPSGFRTLNFLLDRNEYPDVVLSPSDKKIIEEMLDVEQKIEDLVITKGGLVDDKKLMFSYVPDPTVTDIKLDKGISLLALAIVHFRLLRLAYEGHISGEVERYSSFVYPRELDGILKSRLDALRGELDSMS